MTKDGSDAKVEPLNLPQDADPLDAFCFGKVEIVGDIMAPIYTDEEWEAFFDAKWPPLK